MKITKTFGDNKDFSKNEITKTHGDNKDSYKNEITKTHGANKDYRRKTPRLTSELENKRTGKERFKQCSNNDTSCRNGRARSWRCEKIPHDTKAAESEAIEQ